MKVAAEGSRSLLKTHFILFMFLSFHREVHISLTTLSLSLSLSLSHSAERLFIHPAVPVIWQQREAGGGGGGGGGGGDVNWEKKKKRPQNGSLCWF